MLYLFSPSTLKLSYLAVVQNKGYLALLSLDQLQGYRCIILLGHDFSNKAFISGGGETDVYVVMVRTGEQGMYLTNQ